MELKTLDFRCISRFKTALQVARSIITLISFIFVEFGPFDFGVGVMYFLCYLGVVFVPILCEGF